MHLIDKNGISRRENLIQAVKDLPWHEQIEKIPELNPGEMPSELAYIWDYFLSISSGRTYHMKGPNAIAFSEIMSWKSLLEVETDPFEIKLIKEIDSIFLSVNAEKQR